MCPGEYQDGGRTNLTSNGFLFEVVKGDITPDVTVKVDQNGVEARNAIKQFGNVVVRFDLGFHRIIGTNNILTNTFTQMLINRHEELNFTFRTFWIFRVLPCQKNGR